jgi:hypothetical protein
MKLERFIDGHPVTRCLYQTYRYSWAGQTFDIRVLRKVLGQKPTNENDVWFTTPHADRKAAFDLVMDDIEIGLGKRGLSMREARDGGVECALFDADGSKYKLRTALRIKAYLEKHIQGVRIIT